MPTDLNNAKADPKLTPKPQREPQAEAQRLQVDEQTLNRAMTVYANRQNAISHGVGGFLTEAVSAVDNGVREQVRDGFGAMTEAAVVAFVEETVAMDSASQVGNLTAPKYQYKSLSPRRSLSQLNSLLPASKTQHQLTGA